LKIIIRKALRKTGLGLLMLIALALQLFVILFFAVFVLLESDRVQIYLTEQIEDYLVEKTNTKLEVDRIFISFPKYVGVSGVYIEDLKGDTLVDLGEIRVDISFRSLFHKKIIANSVKLDDFTGKMERLKYKDGFNYSFLIDVFTQNGEKDKDKDKPPGEPWGFDVKQLILNNIDIKYYDYLQGLLLDIKFERLNTSVNNISFEGQGAYNIDKISLYGADILTVISEKKVLPDTPPAEPLLPEVSLSELELNNIAFQMKGGENMSVATIIGHGRLLPQHIDLEQNDITIKQLALNDGSINYTPSQKHGDSITKKTEPDDKSKHKNANNDKPWKILADEMLIDGFDLTYNDSLPIEGFHDGLRLKQINCRLNDVIYRPDSINVVASHIDLYQYNGINVKEFKGEIGLGQDISVRNLSLKTGESFLHADLETNINLLNAGKINLHNPNINIYNLGGTIGRDLAKMFPSFNDYFFIQPDNKQVEFGVEAHGKLHDIAMDTLWVKAEKYFACHLTGNAKNILSSEMMNIKVNTFTLMAFPNNIMKVNQANIKPPQNVSFPDHLLLSGKGNYVDNSLNYHLKGFSGKGSFDSKGKLSGIINNDPFKFSAGFDFSDIDLGYFLKNDTLFGKTSGAILASGDWKNINRADIEFDVNIDEIELNKYNYKGFKTKGNWKDKLVSFDMFYKDEYLDFDLETQIILVEETRLKVAGNLNKIFFRELNLREDDLRLTMNIDSDLSLIDSIWAEGDLVLHNARLYQNMDMYMVETFKMRSWSEGNNKHVDINSDFFNVGYMGNISPLEIPSVVSAYINEHIFQKSGSNDKEPVSTKGKNYKLSAKLKPSSLITNIIYGKIEEYHSITLESVFDGDESILHVDFDCQNFIYGQFDLKDIRLNLKSTNEKIDFNTNLEEIEYNGRTFKKFTLESLLADKIVGFNISFDDEYQKMIFNLAGKVYEKDQMWAFTILPENIIINYDNWQIDKDNMLLIGANKYIAENFNLSLDEQIINISTEKHEGEPVELKTEFIDFDLRNIAGLIQDPGFVGGILNGSAQLKHYNRDMTFTTDINCQDFSFRENKIGNINIQASSTKDLEYFIGATIEGYENEVKVAGVYRAKSDSPFDFEVTFPNIEMKSLEGFVYGELSDLEGSAGGQFHLKGSQQNPDLKGFVNFEQTSFTINYLNTYILIPDETFQFENNNIVLENIRLKDVEGRLAEINGVMNLKSIYDITYDLNFASQNFEALNIKEGQNNLFYGKLRIDSDLNIKGDVGSPVVDGKLKLGQGSTFTYIVPQKSPELVGREGVVEFWVPADTLMHIDTVLPEVKRTLPFTNLDMSLILDIDRNTDLRIIMDKSAGDYLEIRGGGEVFMDINPAGEMALTGRYDVSEGNYRLTFYDFIIRRFNIRSGSNLVWTGSPLGARLDVTAVYNTRVPVRGLMESRITAGQNIDQGMLGQILPFSVLMKMKGDLENPEISFEIDMPPEHRNALNGMVYSRIQELNQNESELNKQVFSLLMFDRFMTDNLMVLFEPTDGAAGVARTSVSRLMTQQLNRLSDRYIQNVDLTLDIESYQEYASTDMAGRTELQLELTKDFFDERVIVTVGSNIEIEDHKGRQTRPGDLAGDFSVEYLITEDGSLRLKGFRKNEYADVFEGQVTETGLSMIFLRNFNQFNEIRRRRETLIPEP